MATDVRILLLADSHVGFDLTLAPRVARRRRGHDFLANHSAALEPAVRGEVDLVVHAGDVFDRPSIAPSIAYQALEPLRRVAESGVPVFVVPGNHDGSRLPHARFASHHNLHVFDTRAPSSLTCAGRGSRWWGFPMSDETCGRAFAELLEHAAFRRQRTALRVLCMHHCVEGATVGPGNFTFTTADDVIRAYVPVAPG